MSIDSSPTPLHSLVLSLVAELKRTGILSDLELGNIIETFANLSESCHHTESKEYICILLGLASMIKDPMVSDPLSDILKKLKMGGYNLG